MVEQPLTVGGTYYWLLTAYKNGVIWDITGATITHYFWTPDNDIKYYSMAVLNGSAGTAFHVNPEATFDEKGKWYHSYKVSLSGIILESAPEAFTVYRSLAALAA